MFYGYREIVLLTHNQVNIKSREILGQIEHRDIIRDLWIYFLQRQLFIDFVTGVYVV
jgi:hypothetical protein